MSSPDHASDLLPGGPHDNGSNPRVCPYRTTRFHDQECSRYFDCPTHQIERARSEGSASEDEGEEDEDEEIVEDEGGEDVEADDDDDEEEHEDRASNEASSLSEDRSESREMDEDAPEALVNPHHDVVDLTTPSPEAGHEPEVIDLTSDSPEPVVRAGPSTLTPHMERALPNLPPSASGSISSSHEFGSSGTVSAQRRPGTPPSPPPPVRRRTSTNNFGPGRGSYQQQRPMNSGGPSDVSRPRWQPDAEVTICPICHTQFSIFVRKHHCRKCGRVVCASCSPHRITIPYQYIVQPPGMPRPGVQRYSSYLPSSEGGIADFSSLGGGERVRLCNPCVPDPNINPPQSQDTPSSIGSHGRSQSGNVPTAGYGSSHATPSRPTSYFSTGADDAYGRIRSATMLPSGSRQASGSRSYQSTQNRILSGTPPSHYTYGGPSSSYRAARHRSMLEVGQSSSSAAAAQRRPLPPDPPQLPEEDECPVCHRELPAQDLPNSEALREAHINMCITAHSTYGGTPTGEGAGIMPRRTGMFPYFATEKDCVDSAECTICLEEFEVGVPMARLECLCRFHRECISRWFAKNPGRCPVHQHDSHGF